MSSTSENTEKTNRYIVVLREEQMKLDQILRTQWNQHWILLELKQHLLKLVIVKPDKTNTYQK